MGLTMEMPNMLELTAAGALWLAFEKLWVRAQTQTTSYRGLSWRQQFLRLANEDHEGRWALYVFAAAVFANLAALFLR
jgi:hypothetical protein